MVQVTMRVDCGEGAEWVIIELQGSLETRSAHAGLAGNIVGDLHFNKQGVPILIIGHHILYGKVVVLDKPFGVLQKSTSPSSLETPSRSVAGDSTTTPYRDRPIHNSASAPTPQRHTRGSLKYYIKAFVTKKVVFKTRPKPIVTNVPKKV